MSAIFRISNEIKFVQGYGNLYDSPSAATHMKQSEAQKYVSIHPDHVVFQYGNSKKKNFVVSTKQYYVGKNGEVTSKFNAAMTFATVNAAYDYIEEHGGSFPHIENPVVIDNNFRRFKHPEVFKKQLREDIDSSKRIRISPVIKNAVAQKSDVCIYCGKPIEDEDFTLEHLVPLSRGGTNDISNLYPAHKRCNKMKGNMLQSEFNSCVTDIVCNNIYNSPSSEEANMVIRSLVRGTLAKYDWRNLADVK